MTSCNQCGSCCNPVTLPFTKSEAARAKHLDPATRNWILNDLSPMRPRDVIAAGEGWIYDRRKILGSVTAPGEALIFTYSCRHFDPETRLCTNHENRPPGCRTYPWRDGRPDPTAALPPTCEFHKDVGRSVQPVKFVRREDNTVYWPDREDTG